MKVKSVWGGEKKKKKKKSNLAINKLRITANLLTNYTFTPILKALPF